MIYSDYIEYSLVQYYYGIHYYMPPVVHVQKLDVNHYTMLPKNIKNVLLLLKCIFISLSKYLWPLFKYPAFYFIIIFTILFPHKVVQWLLLPIQFWYRNKSILEHQTYLKYKIKELTHTINNDKSFKRNVLLTHLLFTREI